MSESEIPDEKASLEAALSKVPDSDKLVQFDQHRKVVTSLAESIDKANAQQVKELVAPLGRARAYDGDAVDPERIEWTPPARPFFAGLVGAPRRDAGTA